MGIQIKRSSLLLANGLRVLAYLLLALWIAAPRLRAETVSESIAVPTVTVSSASAGSGFELDGSVQAVRQATLAAQVSGNVVQLAVKAGDRIKAGQLVARIDAREAQAEVQRAEAGVAQAEGVLRNARLAAERQRNLRGAGFVSQAAQDAADTELATAQAGLQQARAALAQASLARGFATLSAPFDAVVLATQAEAGDLALPGRAIATVYAPGALRAVVQLPASMAPIARAAVRVRVLLPDGSTVEPVRQTLLSSADPVAQTLEWRLDLPSGPDAGLVPGKALRVRVDGATVVSAPRVVTVPSASVLRRGELTAVYVAQGAQFVLRAVRIGATQGDSALAVLAGLKPGERIAVDAVRAGLTGAVPAN
jgi:RND family efflux transporter MFP subunit